jgi:hypothetical protein
MGRLMIGFCWVGRNSVAAQRHSKVSLAHTNGQALRQDEADILPVIVQSARLSDFRTVPHGQCDLRMGLQSQGLLLAQNAVTQTPQLAAGWGCQQMKSTDQKAFEACWSAPSYGSQDLQGPCWYRTSEVARIPPKIPTKLPAAMHPG